MCYSTPVPPYLSELTKQIKEVITQGKVSQIALQCQRIIVNPNVVTLIDSNDQTRNLTNSKKTGFAFIFVETDFQNFLISSPSFWQKYFPFLLILDRGPFHCFFWQKSFIRKKLDRFPTLLNYISTLLVIILAR